MRRAGHQLVTLEQTIAFNELASHAFWRNDFGLTNHGFNDGDNIAH